MSRASTTVAQRPEPTRAELARVQRKEFEKHLEAFIPKLVPVVGVGGAKRVAALALDAALGQPAIFDCQPQSVLRSLMKVARTGLEMGEEIHLVPVKDRKANVKKLEAWYDYKGLAKLLLQGGVVRRINGHIVYANDLFKVSYGLNPTLLHEPAEGERGGILGAYCAVMLRGMVPDFEWMTLAQIMTHKPAHADEKSLWVTRREAMILKTPMKMIAKRLPKSPKLVALDREDGDASDIDVPADATAPRPQVRTDGYGESGHERVMTKAEIAEAAATPSPYGEDPGPVGHQRRRAPIDAAARQQPVEDAELVDDDDGAFQDDSDLVD